VLVISLLNTKFVLKAFREKLVKKVYLKNLDYITTFLSVSIVMPIVFFVILPLIVKFDGKLIKHN